MIGRKSLKTHLKGLVSLAFVTMSVTTAIGQKNAEIRTKLYVATEAIDSMRNVSFSGLLKKRSEKLSKEERKGYYQDLLKRPELRKARILKPDDKIVKNVKKELEPILVQFERDGYTELFVYDRKYPFVGLYREFIVILSTKVIELLAVEQLRGVVAHELAHEFFIDELKAADTVNSIAGRHLIEYKCGLAAAGAMRTIENDPMAIADAVELFANWYSKNPHPEVFKTQHPESEERRSALTAFLQASPR